MKKVFILLFVLLFAGQTLADTPIGRDGDEQNIMIKKKGIGHLLWSILRVFNESYCLPRIYS